MNNEALVVSGNWHVRGDIGCHHIIMSDLLI